MSPTSDYLNRNQFAKFCGVAPSTVTGWIKTGMPCESAGRRGREVRIDPRQAVPWVVAHREAPPGSQRERLAKEQADKIALDNATKRGELIYASQVAAVLTELSASLAQHLEAVPGRHADDLVPIADRAGMRAALLTITRSVRQAFANDIGRLAERLVRA